MKIVNIIPHAMSGESHQDSGPNIAVNPNNTNEIVISTLTADPNGGANAPVFVSTDGGNTWALKSIVPNGGNVTAGITVKYGHASNELYAGIVRGNNIYASDILRTNHPAGGAAMTEMGSTSGAQQPYVAVGTVVGGPDAGKDRLYVGMNIPQHGFSPGQTSTIMQTMDALAPIPVFTSISIDNRVKSVPAFQDLQPPQNGPQVRPAVHKDGTVYAIFYSWKSWKDPGDGNGLVTADVVIVRDDNWGQSANPYGSLIDSGDAQAGQRIVLDVPLKYYGNMGQERTGGELSIAVDPTNSSIVYVAWSERQTNPNGIDTFWLHLRRSADRGQTWSHSNLLTIRNGKNPALAINDKGQLGFLYQQLTSQTNSQKWETHLTFSEDNIHWNNIVLARTPAATPLRQFFPYIGDYADLLAVGDTFFGVFCANNTPSLQNFPQGVTYQRNHNFTTKTLLGLNGATPVAPSIDPFFFKTGFIPPTIRVPSKDYLGAVVIILFGIIQDGGGAYIDGQGHIHIIGPGDPGPVWDYLVSLAEYRLAKNLEGRSGLEIQKLALQNIIDLANTQIAQINGQLGRAEE